MTIRKCRVLKGSEIEEIGEAMRKMLVSWCKDWFPSDITISINSIKKWSEYSQISSLQESDYLATWSNDSWCAILTDPDGVQAIGRCLLGQVIKKENGNITLGPITKSVIDEALLALVRQLVEVGGIPVDTVPIKLSKNVRTPAEAFLPWSGAAVTYIRIDEAEITLILSGSVIENILPANSHAEGRISLESAAVISSIENKTINARIKLSPISLSVGDLSNLSPGDVIVLGHKADCPLTLKLDDCDQFCTGYLGKRDGKYAIKLNTFERVINDEITAS